MICPPHLLGRMNAAMRWIVWGTLPLGGLLGGVFGSVLGIRDDLGGSRGESRERLSFVRRPGP